MILKKLLKDKYLTNFKYVFTALISFLPLFILKDIQYTLLALFELGIVFVASNFFIRKYKRVTYVFNSIAILLLNIQLLVLSFASTYINLIIISNLSSWRAVQGRFALLFPLALVVIVVSFLPIRALHTEQNFNVKPLESRSFKLFVILILLESLVIGLGGLTYSPLGAFYNLAVEEYEFSKLSAQQAKESQASKKRFLHDGVDDYKTKPSILPSKPNIILIFTEGLSQHIIDDERNIMPEVAAIQKKSLNFSHYYNHTFATYRGLSGQLYSGYQLNNTDKNYLVSIQDVFKKNGYSTTFLNTEPKNQEFSEYLANFSFDHLIAGPVSPNGVTTDKQAYEELFSILEKSQKEEPIFAAMYTFGTHAGQKSPDEKFEGGGNNLLDRFFNLDKQFGKFMKRLENSTFATNTIVIFTTDHASYKGDEYKTTFPNQSTYHLSLDQVPFFIYYKGIEPQEVDANGRNSLDLTPTILDFLDLSHQNYFLGTSLFAGDDKVQEFSKTYVEALTYLNTTGAQVNTFTDSELATIKEKVEDYYSAARFP